MNLKNNNLYNDIQTLSTQNKVICLTKPKSVL